MTKEVLFDHYRQARALFTIRNELALKKEALGLKRDHDEVDVVQKKIDGVLNAIEGLFRKKRR